MEKENKEIINEEVQVNDEEIEEVSGGAIINTNLQSAELNQVKPKKFT